MDLSFIADVQIDYPPGLAPRGLLFSAVLPSRILCQPCVFVEARMHTELLLLAEDQVGKIDRSVLHHQERATTSTS